MAGKNYTPQEIADIFMGEAGEEPTSIDLPALQEHLKDLGFTQQQVWALSFTFSDIFEEISSPEQLREQLEQELGAQQDKIPRLLSVDFDA